MRRSRLPVVVVASDATRSSHYNQGRELRRRGGRAHARLGPVTAPLAGAALTADDIEQRVLALLPSIRERGEEIASLRRLPRDLVDDLKAAGAFRLPMPV